ncbi:MFS general substrate transporter [Basidiobolus meristosporus CBS 931.73]|uniref:MFS general substrate transporter n=1 Tax=Basidiobolus meristosporus CBS 931.73 TaxID=1314790 RepID=A0A1Y1Z9X5_9FUNG|nr:MFS general substrate transporter [Basidiobolus meristosporus CBS 931.73]|eukprot:ORY07093.1 MFS general substrate transporter [Basidiobolus meristosporus CBS 931.73]
MTDKEIPAKPSESQEINSAIDLAISKEEIFNTTETICKEKIESDADKPPDGGYGWLVVLACFLVHFCILGTCFTWGIFQRYYVESKIFGETSNGIISFVGTIGVSCLDLWGLVAGSICEKLGYRRTMLVGVVLLSASFIISSFSTQIWHLFLTQGFMYSVGGGLLYFPPLGAAPQWFHKRRGLALGLGISGSGIGGLVYNPLAQFLLAKVGIRWTLRIIAIMNLFIGLIATILTKPRIRSSPEDVTLAGYFKVIKDPRLLLLSSIAMITFFGFFVPFNLLPTYAGDIGLTPDQGALITGILNGFSAVGRLGLGITSDYLGAMNTLFLSPFVGGLSILLIWSFAKSFGVLIFFSVVYGIMGGGLISLLPIVTTSMFGLDQTATRIGIVFGISTVGTLLGTPISGAILDSTSPNISYTGVIGFSGGIYLLGAAMVLYLKFKVHRNLTAIA